MAWPTPAVERLIDAMVVAEGGEAAMLRAVRCSIPSCADYKEARALALNTICHALWDRFIEGERSHLTDFVLFLGARWAPIGADNDPTSLNKNWVPNVLTALGKARGS